MDDAGVRRTAALAALGAVSVGEAGVRVSLHAWRSWPFAPARAVTTPVVAILVGRGRREEERIQALLGGGELVDRVTAEVLSTGVVEQIAAQIATSPLLDRALASPELEALLVRVMQSTLVDDLVDQLLASEELQRIVEHVARSEEVRSALRAQSQGLADEVAGEMRTRSAAADDAAERFARRLLHRRRARPGPLGPEPG